MIPKTCIVFLACLFWQSFSGKCLAQQQVGELAIDAASYSAVKMHQTSAASDSTATAPKLSIAPIVAFGFVGFLVGGTVGALFDRSPEKVNEGDEFSLTIKKTALIGAGVGTIAGAYLGYRLAKRDLERKEHRKKTRQNEKQK